jgi:hypothetical protein
MKYMLLKGPLDKLLFFFVCGLFIWFFASSLSIAYHKAPQHDDAMFATIPKNFLNGYGWATSYAEKIPFNPDISTGPTLLLPAMAIMAVYGNQTWVPAMTGAIMNISLAVLIAWQLWRLSKNRIAACFTLLLSISLFAVNDFKTFTAYYTASLLFLLALLIALNRNYSFVIRSFAYGALAAIGLYAKPLIMLSFLLAAPCILFFEHGINFKRNCRFILLMLTGFFLIFSPWNLYRSSVLSGYSQAYQSAHSEYRKKFFENHGTGIGQLKDSKDPFNYLRMNSRKNYRILSNFLLKENNYPIYILFAVIGATFIIAVRAYVQNDASGSSGSAFTFATFFPTTLALVILGNLSWYILLSFAMTPGHAFFLAFFSFFLTFTLIATLSRSNSIGIALCLLSVPFLQSRIPPLIEAYRFRVPDIIDNTQIQNTLHYLETHNPRYPLASCGYNAAPYRLEYLLPKSQNFMDCYNVLEDNLARNKDGTNYYWKGSPGFTFAIEALSFLRAAQSQSYVLGPIADACQQHILFKEGIFIICEVSFDEIKNKLDATETAKNLVDYQNWYRTRIKTD